MTADQKKAVTEWLEKARRGMGGVIETRHFPCESCTALSEARREVEAYKEVEDSLQKEIKRLDREVEELRAERASAFDREFLGQLVRMAWVEWAKKQPNPKPSWLVPWSDLPEADKEADRQIGEFVISKSVNPELLKMEHRAEKAEAEREEAVKALREIVANHTLNGVVATMFCQGCIDDFETAQEALLAAKEVEG